MTGDAHDQRLQRLRQLRNRAERDVSMAFLKDLYKRQIEKPGKQMSRIAETWSGLVPADLVEHTRLESLARGVLRVGVDSSAHLYQLDRLLREGLEHQIIAAARASLRKVQLRLVAGDPAPPARPAAPETDEAW